MISVSRQSALDTRQGLFTVQQGCPVQPSQLLCIACSESNPSQHLSWRSHADMVSTLVCDVSLGKPLKEHTDKKRLGRTVPDNLTGYHEHSFQQSASSVKGESWKQTTQNMEQQKKVNSIGLSPMPTSTLHQNPPWPPAAMRPGSWTVIGSCSAGPCSKLTAHVWPHSDSQDTKASLNPWCPMGA